MSILLKGAIVLDSKRPYKFMRKDVLIKKNKIECVKNKISEKGAQKIDCSTKILLPGLINAHTHISMSILRGVGDDLPLKKWLRNEIWPRERKLNIKMVETGALLGICESIRSGITCFNEMYFHMDSIVSAVQKSKIRAFLGYGMVDLGDFNTKGENELKITRAFIQQIKKKKDELITATVTPHATNTCSKELLEESANIAKENRLILHTHAAETRDELAYNLKEYKKRPIQLLNECNALSKKTILAHGVYVTKQEIKLIAKKGSSVAHCPVSNLKLAGGGSAPIPEYLYAGANICLGTDGAASNNNLDILESMKVGALEQKNFRFNASVIKADDYMQMATSAGARALGLKAGKIAKGYLADLILLDANMPNLVPHTNNAGWLVYAAGPQNITHTMVNGRWLMQDKKLVTLNENKILEDAQRIADKIN